MLAIIVNGQMVARQDYKEAIEFLKENEFNYIEIPYDALELKEFRNNDKNRCYYCKKSIMTKIKEVAKSNGFENVLDGNNFDDTKVFRPGNKATKELQIISLLEEIGFTKQDIRKYSKECGIKFWNKPSNSCLATRFPYDTILTNESLNKVEENVNTEIKSSTYKAVQAITYFACYYMIQIQLPTLSFGIAMIVFCIAYCLISLILAYKYAPKTFKLRL